MGKERLKVDYFYVKLILSIILGVVLQCYGAGNMPSNRQDIIDYLKEASNSGVIIVSCTQCSHGAVSGLYETGKALNTTLLINLYNLQCVYIAQYIKKIIIK